MINENLLFESTSIFTLILRIVGFTRMHLQVLLAYVVLILSECGNYYMIFYDAPICADARRVLCSEIPCAQYTLHTIYLLK